MWPANAASRATNKVHQNALMKENGMRKVKFFLKKKYLRSIKKKKLIKVTKEFNLLNLGNIKKMKIFVVFCILFKLKFFKNHQTKEDLQIFNKNIF